MNGCCSLTYAANMYDMSVTLPSAFYQREGTIDHRSHHGRGGVDLGLFVTDLHGEGDRDWRRLLVLSERFVVIMDAGIDVVFGAGVLERAVERGAVEDFLAFDRHLNRRVVVGRHDLYPEDSFWIPQDGNIAIRVGFLFVVFYMADGRRRYR